MNNCHLWKQNMNNYRWKTGFRIRNCDLFSFFFNKQRANCFHIVLKSAHPVLYDQKILFIIIKPYKVSFFVFFMACYAFIYTETERKEEDMQQRAQGPIRAQVRTVPSELPGCGHNVYKMQNVGVLYEVWIWKGGRTESFTHANSI